MYDPIKDGINKKFNSVVFNESKPPNSFNHLVHSFWELRTDKPLDEDFLFHVIPDACINILFNLLDTDVAAITYRKTEYVSLNLGNNFHYAGIQLLPGVWNSLNEEIQYGFVGSPYTGNLPLKAIGKKLKKVKFNDFENILSELVTDLISRGNIAQNIVIERILSDLDVIESVEDMAGSANLSTRQLQRIIKNSTGFSPHDFLKILRLQQSFKNNYLDYFVDQSHFIHNFKRITGYTPREYFKNFNV